MATALANSVTPSVAKIEINCTVPLPTFMDTEIGRLYDFRSHPKVQAAFQLFSLVELVSVTAKVSQATSFPTDKSFDNVEYRFGPAPRATEFVEVVQRRPVSLVGTIAGLSEFTVSHFTPALRQTWSISAGTMPTGMQLDLRSTEVTHTYANFLVGRVDPVAVLTEGDEADGMVRVQLDFSIVCSGKQFGS